MNYSRIMLDKVDNINIQQNLHLYGRKEFGPYKLVLETNPNNPDFSIKVECQGYCLGRIPEEFARKLAQQLNAGIRHEVRPRKLVKRPETDIYDLIVKIYPVKSRKRLSQNEDKERSKWKQTWIERYKGKKW